MSSDRVIVYRDKSGQFRWHRKAANNQIVSESGESYTNEDFCIAQATRLNVGCALYVDTEAPEAPTE